MKSAVGLIVSLWRFSRKESSTALAALATTGPFRYGFEVTTIHDLPTPCLVIDAARLETNLAAMAARTAVLGVTLRPHVKTHKCVEIARRQAELGAAGLTVSTLYEGRVFADAGFADITWAFPLISSRMSEVEELAERIRLGVVVDSHEAIRALCDSRAEVRVWIKVDCGYHRAGVDPSSSAAVDLADAVVASDSLQFAGILSHSGDAYDVAGDTAARAIAESEREQMAGLAERLVSSGLPRPEVSVGSTPATTRAVDLSGVTEVRPGNYALFDYDQVVLGSCNVSDCAASVLATVVSTAADGSRCVVDAGALALSKDASPPLAPQPTMGETYEDYEQGALSRELRVVSLSQEHGILSASKPVGTRVRILPNHSCLSVACFDEFAVVEGEEVVDRWRIHRGRE